MFRNYKSKPQLNFQKQPPAEAWAKKAVALANMKAATQQATAAKKKSIMERLCQMTRSRQGGWDATKTHRDPAIR